MISEGTLRKRRVLKRIVIVDGGRSHASIHVLGQEPVNPQGVRSEQELREEFEKVLSIHKNCVAQSSPTYA
ncbi:MAG: hypothetical protein QW828_05505 [Candidatus Bathyarchaeia archaeon]